MLAVIKGIRREMTEWDVHWAAVAGAEACAEPWTLLDHFPRFLPSGLPGTPKACLLLALIEKCRSDRIRLPRRRCEERNARR